MLAKTESTRWPTSSDNAVKPINRCGICLCVFLIFLCKGLWCDLAYLALGVQRGVFACGRVRPVHISVLLAREAEVGQPARGELLDLRETEQWSETSVKWSELRTDCSNAFIEVVRFIC